MITVHDILTFFKEKAPFETAEEWDNVGLLVGDASAAVDTVCVALDITDEAIDNALRVGAQLIVSHHPVIFDPLKNVLVDSVPHRLVANGLSAVCMHTNLDKCAGGVNDTLAAALGLTDVEIGPDGMCRVGRFTAPMTGEEFAKHCTSVLGTTVNAHVGTDAVKTVALCGGSGAELVLPLLETADAALTAELKHHEWLALSPEKTVIDGGHYHTEVKVTKVLVEWLQTKFPSLIVACAEQTPPYQTITKD